MRDITGYANVAEATYSSKFAWTGYLTNETELCRELSSDVEGAPLAALNRASGFDASLAALAFEKWGERCAEHLEGAYAFAAVTEGGRKAFLCRDRAGSRSLYYAVRGKTLHFSSSLSDLSKIVGAELDTEGAVQLIMLGPGGLPHKTPLRGIFRLPPGECATFDGDKVTRRRYWRLSDEPHSDSLQEAAHRVRALLTEAVEKNMSRDCGILLSGGLDSSILAALATKKEKNLQSFSVTYREHKEHFNSSSYQPESDERYIDIMNAALGLRGHTVELDAEQLADSLGCAMTARGLPGMADVDASLLLFCREVQKFVPSVLSGECADELFGGYRWFGQRLTNNFPWADNAVYRASFLRSDVMSPSDAMELAHESFKEAVVDADVSQTTDLREREVKIITHLNHYYFMQTLLSRSERMSAAAGVEIRTPFCDHRLAQYAYNIPWTQKNLGGIEKGLLRMAFEDTLPPAVLYRKKSPYPKTHNPAYLALVSAKLRAIIDDPSSPLLQIVEKSALEKLLHAENPRPWFGQLMTVPQTIAYMVQIDMWLDEIRCPHGEGACQQ